MNERGERTLCTTLHAPRFWFVVVALTLLGLGVWIVAGGEPAEPMEGSAVATAERRDLEEREPRSRAGSASQRPKSVSEVEPSQRNSESASERSSVARSLDLFVVAEGARKPIPGAAVVRGIELADQTIDMAKASVTTDPSGHVRLEDVRFGEVIAVVADGFMPHTSTLVESDRCEIELVAGHELEVRCVDEFGRAVAGCTVIAANRRIRRSFGHFGRRRVPNLIGRGGLAWSGVTDTSGSVRFRTLTPSRLVISAYHEAMCALGTYMRGFGPFRDPEASDVLEIRMREMWGLVVRVPGDSEIESHEWEVDDASSNWKPETTSGARSQCVVAQEQRFEPRSFCVVRELPPGARAPVVRFRATCADSSEWGLEWALQPLRSVKVPMRASRINPDGRVRVQAIAGDRELRGLTFELRAIGRDGKQRIPSGEWRRVPAGRYRVRFRGEMFGPREFPRPKVEVHTDRDCPIVVRVPDELTQVTLDVVMPARRRPREMLWFSFEHRRTPDQSDHFGCERGTLPREVWVAEGEVKVGVSLNGGDAVTQLATIRGETDRLKFDLLGSRELDTRDQSRSARTSVETKR